MVAEPKLSNNISTRGFTTHGRLLIRLGTPVESTHGAETDTQNDCKKLSSPPFVAVFFNERKMDLTMDGICVPINTLFDLKHDLNLPKICKFKQFLAFCVRLQKKSEFRRV